MYSNIILFAKIKGNNMQRSPSADPRRCLADIPADIRGGMPIAWLVSPSACAEGMSGNVNILGNSFVVQFCHAIS